MAQINEKASKVVGLALTAFALAGCDVPSLNYLECPLNKEGRSGKIVKEVASNGVIFKQHGEDVYIYPHNLFMSEKPASKMIEAWECNKDLPSGAKPVGPDASLPLWFFR